MPITLVISLSLQMKVSQITYNNCHWNALATWDPTCTPLDMKWEQNVKERGWKEKKMGEERGR